VWQTNAYVSPSLFPLVVVVLLVWGSPQRAWRGRLEVKKMSGVCEDVALYAALQKGGGAVQRQQMDKESHSRAGQSVHQKNLLLLR
jgi:hypothetical protein